MLTDSMKSSVRTSQPIRSDDTAHMGQYLDEKNNGRNSLQTVETFDRGTAGGGVTEYEAAAESLKDLTSLPQGPERLGRVQQLSGSQFLTLLADCRIQLSQLGLTASYHPETYQD